MKYFLQVLTIILTNNLVKSYEYYLYSNNYCDNQQCNGLDIKKFTKQYKLYLSSHTNLSNLPQCIEHYNDPTYYDMMSFLKVSKIYAKNDPSYRMSPFKILVKEPHVFSDDGLLVTVELQFIEYLYFHIYLMFGHNIHVPEIYKAAKLCVRTTYNYKQHESIYIPSQNETALFSNRYSGNFNITGNISD